jgi:hypothetical protein
VEEEMAPFSASVPVGSPTVMVQTTGKDGTTVHFCQIERSRFQEYRSIHSHAT